MSMRVSLVVEANAAAARAELATLTTALDKAGAATETVGQRAHGAGAGLGAAAAGATEARAGVETLAQGLTALDAMLEATGAAAPVTFDRLGAEAAAADLRIDALTGSLGGLDARLDGLSAGFLPALAGGAAQAEARIEALAADLARVQAQLAALFAATRRYEQELLDIAAAEELGAISALEAAAARDRATAAMMPMATGMRALGQDAGVTGANLTNLTFQIQDVAMMASMGQTPLMLMLQQGPQISSVFTEMRRTGQAIGPAVLGSLRSLVSPMSLLTLGAVGAAAALVQWGMAALGAGEQVEDLADSVQNMTTLVDDLKTAMDRAAAGDMDLIPDFGANLAQARELLGLQEQMARLAAERANFDVTQRLTAMLGASPAAAQSSQDVLMPTGMVGGAAIERNLALGDIAGSLGIDQSATVEQVEAVARALDRVALAAEPAERALAFASLRESLEEATGGVGAMSEEVFGLTTQLLDAERAALRLAALRSNTSGAATTELRADVAARAEATRQLAEEEVAAARELASIRRDDEARAQEMLAAMGDQIALQTMINRYGEESAAVTGLRAQQEREAYAALVDSMTIAADLKADLMVNYDVTVRLAAAAASVSFASAANSAAALAANLGISLDLANALAGSVTMADGSQVSTSAPEAGPRLGFGLPGTGVTSGEVLGFGGPSTYNRPGLVRPDLSGLGNSGAGGGGGGAAAAEADAVGALIDRLQGELDVLRETDPVQREMLRLRETLAEATVTERGEVEELIRTREAEKAATEAQARAHDFLGQTIYDFLTGIAAKGASAMDVLRDLGATVLDVIAKGLLLGEGPLGGFFGGGPGGAIGTLLGAFFPGAGAAAAPALALAGGGMVYGAGGPRDDKVPAWLSPGEFIVNARATTANRALLEAVNHGGRMADGGAVAAGPWAAPAPDQSETIQMTFDLRGAVGTADLENMLKRAVQQAVDSRDRTFRRRVRDAMADPRRVL